MEPRSCTRLPRLPQHRHERNAAIRQRHIAPAIAGRRRRAGGASVKVQFNEEQLERITAPVTDRVVEVLARPGEVAEPGRRLLVLDSPDLGAAKSDYAKAVADAERAQHAIDLARDLLEAKAIAQKEVRDVENDYRKAMTERERVASRLRTLGVAETQLKEIVGIVALDDVLMLLGREMYQVAAGRGNVSRCVNEEKAV